MTAKETDDDYSIHYWVARACFAWLFAWFHVSMPVLLKMILPFVGFQGVRRHWRTLRWCFAMEGPQERAVVPELAISPILWDPALSGRAPYCSARLITPG